MRNSPNDLGLIGGFPGYQYLGLVSGFPWLLWPKVNGVFSGYYGLGLIGGFSRVLYVSLPFEIN